MANMIDLYKKRRGKRGKKEEKKDDGTKVKKSSGARRVQVDLDELEMDEMPNCELQIPNKENLQLFMVKMKIDSKDSYWNGATYTFKFEIPDNYPIEAPKVTVLEKIYHPNIDPKGPICLNLLKKDWRPILTVQHVIQGLFFLFLEPNPADPLNTNAADVMRENINTFKSNVNKSLRGQYVDGVQYAKMI